MVSIQTILGKKLEEFRLREGLSKRQLAQKLKISAPYLTEIMSGKKTGKRKILDFAECLGVSIEYLTEDQLLIPVIGEVNGMDAFEFRHNGHLEFLDVSNIPGMTKEMAQKCYALRIKGDLCVPFQKDGDLLIVERGSFNKVKNGDKVVVHDGKSCTLQWVESSNQDLVLHPLYLGSSPARRDRGTTLRHLDKIVYIIPA